MNLQGNKRYTLLKITVYYNELEFTEKCNDCQKHKCIKLPFKNMIK